MGELGKVLFFKSENFLILICNRIGKFCCFICLMVDVLINLYL